MINPYQEYFDTLKTYLLLLGIDKKKGVAGCTEDNINSLKNKKGPLPLAYEAYLRSIGKTFLFEFMDAENMAFDDLDYINSFAAEVFEENALKIEQDFFVISERRNDYISLIYSGEDNPKVWIMSEYWNEEDKGENLAVRTNSFTELMSVFFRKTLHYYTAGFHFIPHNVKNPEKYTREKYKDWFNGLKAIKNIIDQYNNENPLINELNGRFLEYYRTNEQAINGDSTETAKSPEVVSDSTELPSPKTTPKQSFFEKLKAFFS